MMASVGGRIEVLQSPTPAYKDHIAVCRADGVGIGILPREALDDLVESNFVKQDGEEESKAVFELADYGERPAR
jgi:hypothetical protein